MLPPQMKLFGEGAGRVLRSSWVPGRLQDPLTRDFLQAGSITLIFLGGFPLIYVLKSVPKCSPLSGPGARLPFGTRAPCTPRHGPAQLLPPATSPPLGLFGSLPQP